MRRTLLALLAALVLVALHPARGARAAAAPAIAPVDSSELVVFENDVPVATEQNVFQNMGDSLVVVASTHRDFVDEHGGHHPLKKSLMLVVDSRDLGLIRYLSNQDFNNHQIIRGLIPADTSMTYYIEMDGGGNADQVVQPPGRLFVMDSQMFSLFDVVSRSLARKTFTTRRVQLLALLPDSLASPLATVTARGADTLLVAGKKQKVQHYTFEDPSARFEMWSDAQGRLVRLVHPESGLRVERVPVTTAAAGSAKPAHKTSASKPPTTKKTSAATAH